jgi:hypothetical protein
LKHNGSWRRLGGSTDERSATVRLIFASTEDLEKHFLAISPSSARSWFKRWASRRKKWWINASRSNWPRSAIDSQYLRQRLDIWRT